MHAEQLFSRVFTLKLTESVVTQFMEKCKYHVSAVVDGLLSMKRAVFTSDPLTNDTCVFINEHCRGRGETSRLRERFRRKVC